ncbi:MAG: hypothetical protein ACJ8AW_00995 [Rhodopila sp.]
MPRQYSIFMEHVIGVLLPYFGRTTRDLDAMAAEVVETLHSYGVRTRAEFIKAAQIIALSMVTLETLAESTSSDLSEPLRLRYRGCANSLTRSTIECEKALERRLANDSPGKSAHEPATVPGRPATATPPPSSAPRASATNTPQPANDAPEPLITMPQPANDTPEPIDDLSDEEAAAALAHVRAQIDSHRARLAGGASAAAPLTDPDHPAWATALMDAVRQGATQGIAQPTAGPGG